MSDGKKAGIVIILGVWLAFFLVKQITPHMVPLKKYVELNKCYTYTTDDPYWNPIIRKVIDIKGNYAQECGMFDEWKLCVVANSGRRLELSNKEIEVNCSNYPIYNK